MAIIKNVDKLRIREIEENLANDKVLTIDSTGLVAWKNQDEITPDLSAYYTKSEIDALLENISYNDLLDVPTNLSDFNNDEGFITISDVPSYTSGDGIDITNNEIRIKQSVLDEINANTSKTLSDVTSEGNTTNVKMIGSEVFSNTMKEDYAQIKDVNDSGWGLLSLQSEMKIALTAKDGTTVLSSIDVSWLASGDLAVSIDDTDPENPELVFSQGGVEVARIPASALLSGVVRGGGLSDYILQFKDGNNTVLFDIDLEDLFDQHYTKIEADGRFALRTRTITGTGSLTGGGNLTANRTIDLTNTAKSDIAKGVTAHGWGDFREFGLGDEAVPKSGLLEDNNESGFYAFSTSQQGFSFPRTILMRRGGKNYGLIFSNSGDKVGFLTGDELVHTAWHSGNLSDPATETWSDGRFALKTHTHTFASLTSKPTTIAGYGITDFNSLGDARWALRTRTITGTGSITGGGNLTADRTLDLTATAKSDIAKGVTAHGWGNHADEGYATETYVGNAIDDIEIGGRNYLLKSNIDQRGWGYTGSHKIYSLSERIKEGEQVTATININYSGNSDFRVQTQIIDGNASQQNIPNSGLLKIGDGVYRGTFNWSNSLIDSINILKQNPSLGETWDLNWVKLEKGNKPTDWTPALEDQVTDFLQEDEDALDYLKNRELIALKADLSDYQNTLTATGDIEIVDDEIDLKQIVKDDIALGVEANGWGNHAQAGYLKTADADEAYAPAQGYPDWALQLTDLLNF